jgi:hypothetical protein
MPGDKMTPGIAGVVIDKLEEFLAELTGAASLKQALAERFKQPEALLSRADLR